MKNAQFVLGVVIGTVFSPVIVKVVLFVYNVLPTLIP